MDFRLPQPVKYTLKKKKRRWKLLREETKKLSLKHHKRNASSQTDSSESSESATNSTKKNNIQILTTVGGSNECTALTNSLEKKIFSSVSVFDDSEEAVRSIYHYCTPARRKIVKDVPHCSHKQVDSSVTSASKGTSVDVTSFSATTESTSLYASSVFLEKSEGTILEKNKMIMSKSPEDDLPFQSENANHQTESTLSPSSSSKTLTSKQGSHSNSNYLRVDKTSAGSTKESKVQSKPLNRKRCTTIVLSDSDDSGSTAIRNSNSHRSVLESGVNADKELELDKDTSSDMSQFILDSSVSSGDKMTSKVNPGADLKGKNDTKTQTGSKDFLRSSFLNKRFNKVVETDFALSCNTSDFYLRVKKRVLGLHNSNSEKDAHDKTDHNDGDNVTGGRKSGGDFNRSSKNNKENRNRNIPKDGFRRISSTFEVRKSTTIPKSPSSPTPGFHQKNNVADEMAVITTSDEAVQKNSPIIIPESDDSGSENDVSKLKECEKSYCSGLNLGIKKKVVCLENSDTENTPPRVAKDALLRFKRRNKVGSEKSSNPREEPVIPDGELSSSSGGIEYRRKRPVFVIGSSDSEVSHAGKSENQDDIDLINDFHESDLEGTNESNSEGSNTSEEKKLLVKDFNVNSGSSGLFRRVTKRVLALDSSESHTSGKQQETVVDGVSDSKNKDIAAVNIPYKPGFSTLSQTKHEDIKKWLTTIPCSNESEIDKSNDGVNVAKKTSDKEKNQSEEDNINLTDMEQVLNDLYGNDWLNKTKVIPKPVPKKKISQIFIARLTDSDDSSTPPLPASTPKKRLYNQKNNIFTPLTSTGKIGPNLFRTPKTVNSKAKTARGHLGSAAFSSPVLTFIASLSVGHQSARCHPEAKYFAKNFKSKKEELSRKLFHLFNKDVFSSKLPPDLPLLWNNRLRKTAGYCYNRRIKNSDGTFTRTSRVELSSKIVDNTGRLRDTLIHELCHAATWIISEVTGGHGPTWKRWTNKAMEAFPELPPISRCHNYDIVTKYKYKCSSCNYSIGRHSKSLDVQHKVCGICGGKFELFLNHKDDSGKPITRTPRTPNAFALFVKENYGSAKKSKSNLKHKDVMKILSEQFAVTKITTAISEEIVLTCDD